MSEQHRSDTNIEKGKSKKRVWLRVLVIVLASLLGLLLVGVIALFIIGNNLLNLMDRTPPVSTTMSKEHQIINCT